MDCDTTGIEPDFALVKFKKLAGGGYFKIINNSVPAALKNLGYSPKEAEAIINYAKGAATLEGCPFINPETLAEKGFTTDKLEAIEAALPSSFDIKFASINLHWVKTFVKMFLESLKSNCLTSHLIC